MFNEDVNRNQALIIQNQTKYRYDNPHNEAKIPNHLSIYPFVCLSFQCLSFQFSLYKNMLFVYMVSIYPLSTLIQCLFRHLGVLLFIIIFINKHYYRFYYYHYYYCHHY